jgi:2-polyprenyl-6-methoxyphenol hydroxylase-like FAD-dependent oxidoreductase
VTLLERFGAPADVGAGLLLQPNGLAVLHGLGLGDALAGHAIPAADIRRSDGRLIMRAPIADHGSGLDHALAVRRSALYRLLYDEIARTGLITTRLSAEVVTADPAGDVHLADGQSLTADLVIAADGVKSVVRATGGFDAVLKDTGLSYLRATVEGCDVGLRGEYWTELGLFGGAPLGDGSTYFYAAAQAPSVAAAMSQRDLPALRALWAEALPLAAPLLEAVPTYDDLLVNAVARVDVKRWSHGALVLLGDAAHAMAPTLGQGANSALVDAAVLAHELARDDATDDALQRYTRRRRGAVRKVQDAADRVARLSNAHGRLRTSAIDRTLRTVAAVKPVAARQDRLVQQEDPAELLETVTGLCGGPQHGADPLKSV